MSSCSSDIKKKILTEKQIFIKFPGNALLDIKQLNWFWEKNNIWDKKWIISVYRWMLLLLSRFSRVRLCATPETAAHQAPLSLGFFRQEHEWVAISFSNAWNLKVKVKSLSHVRLLVTPWTTAYQAPPSIGFSRQEYWSGLPLSSPEPNLIGDKVMLKRYISCLSVLH